MSAFVGCFTRLPNVLNGLIYVITFNFLLILITVQLPPHTHTKLKVYKIDGWASFILLQLVSLLVGDGYVLYNIHCSLFLFSLEDCFYFPRWYPLLLVEYILYQLTSSIKKCFAEDIAMIFPIINMMC